MLATPPGCLLSQRPLACPPPLPPPRPPTLAPAPIPLASTLSSGLAPKLPRTPSCRPLTASGQAAQPVHPGRSRSGGDRLDVKPAGPQRSGPSDLCNAASPGLADEPARVDLTTPSGCCSGAGPGQQGDRQDGACPPPSCPPGCLHSFPGGGPPPTPRQARNDAAPARPFFALPLGSIRGSSLHPASCLSQACGEQLGPSGAGLGPRRPSRHSAPR